MIIFLGPDYLQHVNIMYQNFAAIAIDQAVVSTVVYISVEQIKFLICFTYKVFMKP